MMRRIKRLMAIAAAGILMTAVCTGCSSAGRTGADPAVANNRSLGSSPAPVPEGWSGIKRTGSMELLYADQFSVDYYDGGYAMITIKDSGRYLVVPEGKSQPSGLPGDVAVIKQPLENIYLQRPRPWTCFAAWMEQTGLHCQGQMLPAGT